MSKSEPFEWANAKIPLSPPDSVFFTKVLFARDKFPNKQNLGIGAYRTESGKPYVFQVVRDAAKRVLEDPNLNFEYPDILGNSEFVHHAKQLIFGKGDICNRTASSQTISGTGACRIGATFLSRFAGDRQVYISDPTWILHEPIFHETKFKTYSFRYWDQKNRKLNIGGMLQDIEKAQKGSIFLLQACAHNPTGVDPTPSEWKLLSDAIKKKDGIIFLDAAYQGFATGSFDNDAFAARFLAEEGHNMLVAQSFSKNMGLYSQRTGCLHVVCSSPKGVPNIESQFEEIIRPMYTCPPQFGASVAAEIMKDSKLRVKWESELQSMSQSMVNRRKQFRGELEKLQVPSPTGDWSHITSQIGMFSYTGLSAPQCKELVSKYHIYILSTGRISVAGLLPKSIPYIANAFLDVVKRIR